MRTLIICISIFSSLTLFGQTDTPFEKEYFPNDKEGFKQARDAMREGDKIFEEGNMSYFNLCIPYYEQAYSFNPNSAELNYKLGVCYLNSPIKSRCLKHFEKSKALNPNFDTFNINYLLARGYHLTEQWDKAIEYYTGQIDAMRREQGSPEEFEVIEKHLQEARNGKSISEEKVRVWIDNLGPAINSAAPEYAPLISTDESLLILTARRNNSIGGLRDEVDNLPFEDLYYSKNIGGEWTPLTNLGENVNTSGHDASSGLSPDGRSLFVFRGTMKGGGDVYISRDEQGAWTKPKSLSKNVNSSAHESAIALSYDGSELYFVSEREGGIGGKDIYIATYDYEREEWGEARNLGAVINSKYDEDGVFIHPDGKTLYFSSKGHNSMGGNDIFYSERVNGKWSEPINIGYPINTPDDDVFFVVAADGRTAYYSSIREEGYGEKDIYRITFLGPEKQPVLNVEEQLLAGSGDMSVEVPVQKEVKIRTSHMILLKGQVLDEETNAPLVASIDLVDNETSELLASFKSDELNGAYLVSLPAGRNYGLNVNADGYLFNSMNFNLPDTAVFKEVYKIIKLKKIKIGKSIVLRNIFFDYNQFSIRSESQSELERLVSLMNENPQIKVEISGHTDNVGGDKYNLDLSENRAKAVVENLVQAGIAQDRLLFKGYGESQPIASNDIPEGRQENRRTEFKIIE